MPAHPPRSCLLPLLALHPSRIFLPPSSWSMSTISTNHVGGMGMQVPGRICQLLAGHPYPPSATEGTRLLCLWGPGHAFQVYTAEPFLTPDSLCMSSLSHFLNQTYIQTCSHTLTCVLTPLQYSQTHACMSHSYAHTYSTLTHSYNTFPGM